MKSFIHAKKLVAVALHIDTYTVILKNKVNLIAHLLRGYVYYRATVRVFIFNGIGKQVLQNAFQVGGDIINLRAATKVGIYNSVCPVYIGVQGRCYVIKYGFKIK
jgi:hypothetical protein